MDPTQQQPAPAAAVPANPTQQAPPGAQRQNVSLYVGDLNADVTEQTLFDIFKKFGPIPSIRVLRDAVTSASLGYAYVNFTNTADADNALQEVNYTKIRERPCRIMYVNRDPSLRKSGVGNIIIRNLPKQFTNRDLFDIFGPFGAILSCKVQLDAKGESKGMAFVHFSTAEAAENAVKNMNDKNVSREGETPKPGEEAKPLKVEPYQPQPVLQQRLMENFTNMFIKNIKTDVTDEKLKEVFDSFGETLSVRVMRDSVSGESRGFGFCSFKSHDMAVNAINNLHDKPNEIAAEGKSLYVQRAMKKSERTKFNLQVRRDKRSKYAQHTNLYVKNLDDNVTTEKLMEVFKTFGEIASAKVMADPVTKYSKGFAFVSFINASDAKRAVEELANTTRLSNKPLFVTYAQNKEERRKQLEAYQRKRFQQMGDQSAFQPQGGMMPPHYAPPMQAAMYPGFAAGMFPGGMGAPQGGMGGPRPMMQPPQIMSHGRPMPGPGAGSMRPAQNPMSGGMPQMRPMPSGPHHGAMQQMPLGAGSMRPPPTQNAPPMGGSTMGMGGPPQMRPMPMGPAPPMVRPVQQQAPPAPMQPKTLQSASGIDHAHLAALPTEQQRNILGEKLYHNITRIYPEQAAKITGMLLEMDNAEIVNLLDSRDLLNQKVEEAVEVLRQHNK